MQPGPVLFFYFVQSQALWQAAILARVGGPKYRRYSAVQDLRDRSLA